MNEMRRGKGEVKLARTLLQGLKHRAEQGRQRTPSVSCPEQQKRQQRGRGQGGVSALAACTTAAKKKAAPSPEPVHKSAAGLDRMTYPGRELLGPARQ